MFLAQGYLMAKKIMLQHMVIVQGQITYALSIQTQNSRHVVANIISQGMLESTTSWTHTHTHTLEVTKRLKSKCHVH
jgi:hypothetical protein